MHDEDNYENILMIKKKIAVISINQGIFNLAVK
jgi:hypothetical protein